MEKSEKELLIEANGIIRSFYSIAQRKGSITNWEAFENRVSQILKEQHEYMFPTVKQIRKRKLNRLNEQNPK